MSNKLVKNRNNEMLSKDDKCFVDQIVLGLNLGIDDIVIKFESGEIAFFFSK